MLPLDIGCSRRHTPSSLAHCVTVVCFIHSWIIQGLMGGCGNGRDAATPFICAPVHPHSPFAIRRGKCVSRTPALHVSDTHCLIDTTQWYTPSSGAGVDIWAAETKGNGAHFSASTYSSVVCSESDFSCCHKRYRVTQQSRWQL